MAEDATTPRGDLHADASQLERQAARARAPHGPLGRLLLAHAQSSLGTGITLVALPLVALERYDSSAAVAGVLLADLLPAMLLGAWLGAAADRWPRRTCAVIGDLLRVVALVGVALSPSYPVTFGFAALAGVGSAVFQPAVLAGIPHVAGRDAEAGAMSAYCAIGTATRTIGALVAALIFALVSPAATLLFDAATFAVSALLVATVDLGRGSPETEEEATADEPRLRIPGLATIICASSAVFLAGGMSNVAEPSFIDHDLAAGASGFALVMAAWAAGMVAGSAAGRTSTSLDVARRRYLLGILVTGASFVAAAATHSLVPALIAFAVNGAGNGLVVVHERLLISGLVPERHAGRAFGLVESAASWALAVALLGAAVLVQLAGARTTILAAGIGTLVVWAAIQARPIRVAGPQPVAT